MLQNLKSVEAFLEKLNLRLDRSRFFLKDEYVYYLPEGTVLDRSLHYIRTGLLLGRVRNERFEPSQAFAMQLHFTDWKNPLNLKLEDDRVLKYLKGETIEADDTEEGYRLLCVDGHPLGWIKQSGTRCKNKYYPGWRYN